MSTRVAPGEIVATPATVRPRLRTAGRVAAVASVLGIVGQLLYFGVAVGINYPLSVALALGAAWLLRPQAARFDALDAWLPAVSLVLAGFVALRGDPVLVFFDILASLGLAAGALAAIGGQPVTRRLLPGLLALIGSLAGWTTFGGARVLADAAAAARPSPRARGWLSAASPYFRGALIALPVVIVFAALFSSADAVFARLMGDLFGVELNLGELPGRLAATAVFAWIAAGALAFVAEAPPRHDATIGTRFRFLGTPETLIVLVAVDAVFAVFVVLQAAYLFGGLDTVAASGIGYAEYARRGFFELLAVAALAGGLVLATEAVVRHRSRAYVTAAVGLMVLTAVVLASAFLRLRLYQDAFGWTELRFYVLASIGWLAIGIGIAIGCLVRDRSRWLVHRLVLAAAVVGVTLNVIGPVRYVAEQNLARVANPSLVPAGGETGIDAAYIASLGDDALAQVVAALPGLPAEAQTLIGSSLDERRIELRSPETRAWQAWNLGRERAREALGP